MVAPVNLGRITWAHRAGPGALLLCALLLTLSSASPTSAAEVTRGPYLQSATDDSIIIRWRTDTATDSQVDFGSAPGSLTQSVYDPALTTEHILTLTGLSPDARYFYSIGSSTEVLAGDDADHFFYTNPIPGTRRPIRAWLVGDTGYGSTNQADVRDAYYTYTGSTRTELWLHVGDVSQSTGTDAQYQTEFFDMYPGLLRQVAFWPTFGNHDAAHANSSSQSGPYYDNFTLPTGGEAGGFASGTEAYYSFDYANIHFVVLNSTDVARTTGSAMLLWLAADVADTAQDWVIAYWHHPPYSKGSHNSDTEIELIEMREYVLPILEDYGVDLVFTGHTHAYERSYLIDGHYGDSSEFGVCDDNDTPGVPADDFCVSSPSTPCPNGVIDCDFGGFIVDGGDGRVGGDGAYQKAQFGPDPHSGTVYTVAGTGGQVYGGDLDHPANYISWNVLGSVVLDINEDRLDAIFLDSTGVVRDSFTLIKGVDLDEDGVLDSQDNCLGLYNPGQEDSDTDGLGNPCDNCPTVENVDQIDSDSDGYGDDCDDCAYDPLNDIDSDTVCGDIDNCPTASNSSQTNSDIGVFGLQDVIFHDARSANSVFAADIDGDGDNDVLSASYSDHRVAWYENTDGAGSFGPRQTISTDGIGAWAVFAADMDSDGDIDVLSASYSDDKIAWYENTDGDGTFGSQQVISTSADYAMSVFAADVDGDGDLDALSASYSDDKIAWYENVDGDGTFGSQQVISTATNGARAVFAADIDSDGDQDVLSASALDDKIAWYENMDGDGTFGSQQVIATANDGVRSICAADIDGDGDLDVAAASYIDDEIAWYENTDGSGTFGSQQLIATSANGAYSVVAVDVDGDGDMDLLSASELDDKIAWYENTDGDGTFGSQRVITTSADGATSVFAADIDGDGLVDALSASLDDDKIAWYKNGDTLGDACDDCPNDPLNDIDSDTICGDVDTCPGDPDNDVDSDAICVGWGFNSPMVGEFDNCPTHANPGQSDTDSDGRGDVCDATQGVAELKRLTVAGVADRMSSDNYLMNVTSAPVAGTSGVCPAGTTGSLGFWSFKAPTKVPVLLTLDKSPSGGSGNYNIELTWTGRSTLFEVYRNSSPSALVGPGNLWRTTNLCNETDQNSNPFDILFYSVIE